MHISFVDRNFTGGPHTVYCSNNTDAWDNSTVLYNAEYLNEDVDVFAVCKYIIYIPPIIKTKTKIGIHGICEIEIGGKYFTCGINFVICKYIWHEIIWIRLYAGCHLNVRKQMWYHHDYNGLKNIKKNNLNEGEKSKTQIWHKRKKEKER